MKKAFLLLFIGLCLAAVAVAGIDLSGTWVLDTAKSDPMGGRGGGGGGGGAAAGPIEIVVKQDATELSITRTFGGNAMETKYTLDGAEHTATSQRGDTKYKAVISADGITVSGTQPGRGGEQPFKAVYSVSADGKVLTVATTTTGQNGEQTRKQVYNKK